MKYPRHGLFRALAALGALIAVGCGDDDRGRSDAATPDVPGTPDVPAMDVGTCSSDPECDDGFECTIDACGVGGVCRHDPLNERCPMGETCSIVTGCNSGCATDVECQNGMYCDGAERCVAGTCFPAQRPVDCNDNNDCTEDMCSNATEGCQYTTVCDAGVVTSDGGMPPVPFDPTMHYAGNFLVAPAPSLGCPPASYAIGNITFRVVGDTLEIMADRFRLTQTPVPTGPAFSATSNADSQCTSVSLSGMFSNSNQLSAQWNASCSGACGSQTNDIVGERND